MEKTRESGEFVLSVHCAEGVVEPVWIGCIMRGRRILDVTEVASEGAAWEWCEAEARRRG